VKHISHEWAEQVYERVIKLFEPPMLSDFLEDPFEALVVTIISQNTNDLNTSRAFRNLRSLLGKVTPEKILKADLRDLEEALRIAGLYKNKSRVLKEIAQQLVDRYGGDLWAILNKPLEEARRELLSLRGVGYKTADVLLLFNAKKPVMPIDTHIMRVSKRMGLASVKAQYEDVRRALEDVFRGKDFFTLHLALINLGRRYCRARRPLCSKCPLNDLCPKVEV